MYHGRYVLNHATKSFTEAVELRKEAEKKVLSSWRQTLTFQIKIF